MTRPVRPARPMRSARPIIVDIGEFYRYPIRTGIQRVVRELISHWPEVIPVRYGRYDHGSGGLVAVSAPALRILVGLGGAAGLPSEEAHRQAEAFASKQPPERIDLGPADKVLVPELFYGAERVAFYVKALREASFSAFLTVFDFMPWLQPDAMRVAPMTARLIMPYLDLVIRAEHRAFISEAVRRDFLTRIVRKPNLEAGPVITLGADALRMDKQVFRPDRRDIVCLGSFDGKKRQDVVFRAFRSLRPEEKTGKLLFLGKVPANLAPWLREVVSYEGTDVEVFDDLSDEDLAGMMRRARASVFTSTAEGFGLPAWESLHAGIPIIASAELPALETIGEGGQIRLGEITDETVAAAIRRLGDDRETERLWQGAAELRLPTWADYATATAEWVGSA